LTEKRAVREGYAELNGARFYYEVAGRGEPLVLVHAGIADRRMWNEQFEVFARDHMVVRYDRRGFGRTEMVAGPFSHHQDLYELLRYLGIKRATLMGCSQGGKTVLDLALEHPLMVERLVLVASALGGFTFAGEPPRQWAELEEADKQGDLDGVNELELQIWVDGQSRTPQQVDRSVRELVREMNLIALKAASEQGSERPLEPPAVDRLDEIRVPALVVVGELDTPKTLAAADLLAEKISGARKVVIKDAAHLPNMEKPQEFNRHVLAFLNSLH
jgi:pimeloyl-ACP methyl ester carboxylesterase